MMKFDTRQLTGLQAKLAAFGAAIKTEVAIEGAAGMAVVIYDEVKLNAERNKKSGLLHGAIYRVYSPEKSTATSKLYRVSWNKKKAPHGHLVEFGTSTAPAHPFLRPALSKLNDAIAAGQARMAKKLTEIGGKP